MSNKRIFITAILLTVLLASGCSVFEAVLQPDLPDNIDTAKEIYFGLDLKGTEPAIPSGKFPGMVWFFPGSRLFGRD